jgi:hypothetical protein
LLKLSKSGISPISTPASLLAAMTGTPYQRWPDDEPAWSPLD